jgi:hypothetical protein
MEKLGMTYNPKDDFEHPKLPEGHPLRPHVLYRKAKCGSGLDNGWPLFATRRRAMNDSQR